MHVPTQPLPFVPNSPDSPDPRTMERNPVSRTLLIDNYDSFTYNLAALIAEVTGVEPTIVRNDEGTWDELQGRGFDRIVISPGPGRPQCRSDLGLSADALEHATIPILGVCLGHQAIGHFYGANVGLANEPIHGRIGRIIHEDRDLFAGIPSPFEATRYHSLAVTDLPPVLEATAWCDDGTLMGLRHVSRPIWGVQFHPESICTEYGHRIIQNFYEMSAPFLQSTTATATEAVAAPSTDETPLRLHVTRCSGMRAPNEAFEALFADRVHAFWLDSSRPNQTNARFSYFGDASGPRAEVIEYFSTQRQLRIRHRDDVTERTQDIFSYLQAELSRRAQPTPDGCPFDFNGGYVGYFGYELKGELQGAHVHPAGTPDACWIFADRTIAHDHETGEYWLLCLDDAGGLSPENHSWIAHVQAVLSTAPPPPARNSPAPVRSLSNLQWRHSPECYLELIHRSKELIRNGETYEVCLTNEVSADIDADPLHVYQNLRQVNAVPFGAFLRLDDVSVLCASPELYLDINTERVVESKPIKGTAPRHADPGEDHAIAARLASSVKDRSENLMIVDLLRNDLNRCCEVGSVHVPKIFHIESFATVHQLVSTIRGKLKGDRDAIDCVRESFPGGSMTGAPKVRTMSIIDELEAGPRGVYSGSIGYISLNGSARLNIVIRTIVMKGGRATIGAGGAIVALSDPQDELDEIRLKARAQVRILQSLAGDVERNDALCATDAETAEQHAVAG